MVFVTHNESLAEYTPRHFMVWMLLTFQAGCINVGGFLAFSRFVSHTTGFATFFGVEWAQGHYDVAFGMLVVPGFFLLGCMIASVFTERRRARGKDPRYDLLIFIVASILTIVAFLGGSGIFGAFGEGLSFKRDFIAMALLTLAAGIQNAAITSASGTQVRTTHLTGVTTDLGMGLVRLFTMRKDSKLYHKELRANALRASQITAFVTGSLIGAVVFIYIQYLGFLLPGVISFSLFLYSRMFFSAPGAKLK